jgi:phosphatidylinositol glycan class C protein
MVKASLLIFLALIALAPILRTLTAPTSADSISALTMALFLVHAVLADYSYAASLARRERCVFLLPFWALISKTSTGLEKVDLGALDQCCDFGCSRAGLAPA